MSDKLLATRKQPSAIVPSDEHAAERVDGPGTQPPLFVTVHEMPYAHSSTAQRTLIVTALPPNVKQLRDETVSAANSAVNFRLWLNRNATY